MSESKISCPHCEQHIMLDDAWAGRTLNCPACGQTFQVPGLAAEPATATEPGPARVRLSQAPPSPPTPPPLPARPTAPGARTPARPSPRSTQAPRTSGLAIASLVLSIFGCTGIAGIAAVICGHLARKQIRHNPQVAGKGLALAGLIIGYSTFAMSIVAVVLLSIGLAQAKKAIKELESSEWAMVEIPEDPVAGTIKNDTFTYLKSTLMTNMGMLTISDSEGFIADREVKIMLNTRPGENLVNRTWTIAADSMGPRPQVFLTWQENGMRRFSVVTAGYDMVLKTGELENGTISGNLALTVKGAIPAELKGNFTARTK